MSKILFYFLVIQMGFCFYMIIRCELVLRLRLRVIAIIFSKKDWEWRREEFKKVSFEKMLWKFWLPVFGLDCVKYFWKDEKFLK